MAVSRAAGYPDYSSAGTSAFIPEIWSTKLVEKWYDATVLTHISNTNYEGEIKAQGDTVWIRTRGSVPWHTYTKGMQLAAVDRIESAYIQLLIDKAAYARFGIDDVDKYQSDIDLMNQWAEDAIEQEKIDRDTEVLAWISANVDSHNKGIIAGEVSGLYNLGASTTPVELTTANIIKYILMAGGVLGEQNVPQGGWFIVMPEAAAVLLRASDVKDASMMGDNQSTLRSGRLGRIGNFTLYASNLLPSVTDPTTSQLCFDIIFGHPYGITYASQFVETDYIDKPESTFGKHIKSLHVYGYEMIKATAVGVIYGTVIFT